MRYDYLIVGAGLFGSVFACEATKRGKKCLVIDRRDHIGGNIYTEEIEGINVHKYGAHIFHTKDKAIWDYINQFAEFNNFINSPIARIGDEVYNLPFNMNTFSKMWGVFRPEEAMEILESQRLRLDREPRNLEEQALVLVGTDVYEKLIKGYTEKQWGRSCTELPPEIIKRLPVRMTYDNNYFSDPYQGIPIGGYTRIIEKMLEGSDVRLNCDYLRDIKDFKTVADKMVFTGMIDEYYGYRFGHLEYRSLRFETRVEDTDNYQGVAVVNYTGKEVPYTRVIEHRHFESTVAEKTIVTEEYPQEWRPGIEAYYPINDTKNQSIFLNYIEEYHEDGISFGGRLGLYRYLDMDATIRTCLNYFD